MSHSEDCGASLDCPCLECKMAVLIEEHFDDERFTTENAIVTLTALAHHMALILSNTDGDQSLTEYLKYVATLTVTMKDAEARARTLN